jgi:hypothetical protein
MKVDWLGAADINAIQAHPIVRQERIRATEKCRGKCQVRQRTQRRGGFPRERNPRAPESCNVLGAEVGADLRRGERLA